MEYFSKKSEEVIREFSSSKEGLSEEEVKKRLVQHGLNDIPKRMERSPLHLFLSQVKDPLVIALAVAAVISYLTGGVDSAIIIFFIILTNAIVGFVQEFKSEKALQGLVKYLTYSAKVFRDGRLVEVDTRYIVPGDILFVETGDRIPADLRVIEAHELEIDESMVTGESYPVHKVSALIEAEKLQPQEMKNMAFMGTLVVSGKGKGIVVSTGMKSTFGEIVGYLKSEEPSTNYQKNISNFSSFLIKAITLGVVFIFIANSLTAKTLFDSALFSLALAVGIIPEALPIIITVGLSRGAIHMGRRGVIVKKLAIIEDLGDMDVLCTDKTGTLTENRVTLEEYFDLDGRREPEIVTLASACTSVVHMDGKITGNPVDVAIVEYVKKKLIKKYEILDLIPFDYERKRMSVVLREGKKSILVCKGAPESIVSVCRKMKTSRGIVNIDRTKVKEKFEDFFNRGYRVIALSMKTIKKKAAYRETDEKDLVLLGFLCFMDPPKFTARHSVLSMKRLGVGIKILTGDSSIVTQKIAKDIEIEITGVVTGEEIDKMDDAALSRAVEKADIFARLTPDHKVRVVTALKKNGHVVGFLGDGVNDAPALRYSDVGISVNSGVDVAKEAADIILTKKSLSSILEGVEEGRRTFHNTTKYILNTVSANIGNMTTLAIISPFLPFLPLLPPQILLTNLVSDGPLLAISTDRVDAEELKKPKNWDIRFIGRFSAFFGGISSIFDFITIIFLMFFIGASATLFRTAWFIESTLSEILVTFSIRTRKRFFKSRPGGILVVSSLLFALIAILVTYPPTDVFFEFIPMSFGLLIRIIAIVIGYCAVVEFAKHVFYRHFGGTHST